MHCTALGLWHTAEQSTHQEHCNVCPSWTPFHVLSWGHHCLPSPHFSFPLTLFLALPLLHMDASLARSAHYCTHPYANVLCTSTYCTLVGASSGKCYNSMASWKRWKRGWVVKLRLYTACSGLHHLVARLPPPTITATAAAAMLASASACCCEPTGSLPARCAGGLSLLTRLLPARLRCCWGAAAPGMPAIWRRLAKLVGPCGPAPSAAAAAPAPPASSLPWPVCRQAIAWTGQHMNGLLRGHC